MPVRDVDEFAEIARERELAAVESSNERFDRLAFAERALRLVRPPHTTVALCEGRARVKVEAGRAWGQAERAARWAVLSVPPNASKRAIAVAVAGLAGPEHEPYVLDVLLGGDRRERAGMSNPNYITLEGAKRLQEELARLRSKDRPKIVQEVADAAAQGDRSENAEYIYGKRKLREIDRRMYFLTKRLESAVIVEPRSDGVEKVFFGAIVVVEDEDGARMEYQVVGEDEIDLKRNRISWRSPLGRTLLGKKVDDVVVFRKPNGEVELTLVSVRYV